MHLQKYRAKKVFTEEIPHLPQPVYMALTRMHFSRAELNNTFYLISTPRGVFPQVKPSLSLPYAEKMFENFIRNQECHVTRHFFEPEQSNSFCPTFSAYPTQRIDRSGPKSIVLTSPHKGRYPENFISIG